jgi:hypothetical protein
MPWWWGYAETVSPRPPRLHRISTQPGLSSLPRHNAPLPPSLWEYLRGNALSHQIWETYEDIVDACCNAWNSLMRTPDIIRSIATRNWAQVST